MPPSWAADVAAGSLLPAAPDNPGGTISNGYVGAWVPRGLPGSAGSPVCGAEHVKGVFAPASSSNGALYGYSNATKVQLAALGSWTATAFLASIGTAKLPATASAMDFRRAAYRVASKAGDVECVQSIYAHRSRPHLLISEFECENKGAADATVTVDQGRCNPLSLVDDYIYETLCPRTNGSQHGYVREARPSGMAGVACSLSTMAGAETPSVAVPTLGECHTEVPKGGLPLAVAAGQTARLSLISARYSNMDDGRHVSCHDTAAIWVAFFSRYQRYRCRQGTAPDPVASAKRELAQANASAATLLAEHVAAVAELNEPGIEVEGNLQLARMVNSSIYALLGAYRNDSKYSSAPEGLVSTRYSGHAFWVRLKLLCCLLPCCGRRLIDAVGGGARTSRHGSGRPGWCSGRTRPGPRCSTEST